MFFGVCCYANSETARHRLEAEWHSLAPKQFVLAEDRDGVVALMFGQSSHTVQDPASLLYNAPPEGFISALDGFIGNIEELTKQLFLSQVNSDCAPALADILRHYPERMINRLRGQFSILSWQSRRRRLLLATDHLGIGGLYYVEAHGALLFSTDLRQLIRANSVVRRRNDIVVASMLAFARRPESFTPCRDVYRIPGGHALVLENGNLTLSKYWEPNLDYVDNRDEEELIDDYRKRFLAAVGRCLTGTSRAGVALSGGVDSSSVLCAALKSGNDESRIVGATADVWQWPRCDERSYLSLLKMHKHVDFVSQKPSVSAVPREAIAYAENPLSLGWYSLVAAAISAAALVGCDVVLTGEFRRPRRRSFAEKCGLAASQSETICPARNKSSVSIQNNRALDSRRSVGLKF